MTPINSFNDPSIGSIESYRYGQFLRSIFLVSLGFVVAIILYELFFKKKETPKQKGDDKV